MAGIVFIAFLAALMVPYARLRTLRVRKILLHGERAVAVCEFNKWDEGKAASVCYFFTSEGKRTEVSTTELGRPLLSPGDTVTVAYDAARPTQAVIVEDQENRIHEMRIVFIIGCAGVAVLLLCGVYALLTR